MNRKRITPFPLNDFQENNSAFMQEDFHGFLTCDNITLKMIARAKRVVEHGSNIVWIEGEVGTGKSLLAQAIVTEYRQNAPYYFPHDTLHIHYHPSQTEYSWDKHCHIIHIGKDISKEWLVQLQHKLTTMLRLHSDEPLFVALLTYPLNHYPPSVSQQLAMMRQLFIEHQHEYMLLQPLRNRQKDLSLLLTYYIEQFFAVLAPHSPPVTLTKEALEHLIKYEWVHNVKELQYYCFTFVQLLQGNAYSIQLIDDALHLAKQRHDSHASQLKKDFQRHLLLINKTMGYSASTSEASISLFDNNGNVRSLAELEQEIVNKTCRHMRGSKTLAAKKLGVGRTTLYRKLRMEGENE